MKKNTKLSTRLIILIPVFILGIFSIISNMASVANIRNVNKNATRISEESLQNITKLAEIQKMTQDIHKLGLSHIIATNLDSMIKLVDEIRTSEDELETALDEYKDYVSKDTEKYYKDIKENYEELKLQCDNVMAYSAAGKSEAAYTLANGTINQCSDTIESNIEEIKKVVNQNADVQRKSLTTAYRSSLATSAVTILISIVALLAAVIAVVVLVIRPLRKTNNEIKDIITGIDNRQGDLTRRVTITVNQEVASVGTGINSFMGKLQKIFQMISSNASELEGVVNEVRESVQTSNESVSDLSALTEELSATMQDISDNASRINENTESVAEEVQEIAQKTSEINQYTKEMKEHAEAMENAARENMSTTGAKVSDIVQVLNQAIEDGVSGVVSAADSTQVLVSDMDKISHKMDENFAIADGLRKETSVFTKL